jgi:hypothetical protein
MDGRSRWLTTPGWVESVCVLQHDAVWTTRHILLLLSQHMRTWRHMHAARSVPSWIACGLHVVLQQCLSCALSPVTGAGEGGGGDS